MAKVEIAGVDTSFLPRMANEKQLEYLSRIRGGDKEARTEFIHANMRLVLSVIQRYINKKGPTDDYFQIGCIGLIKAIDNFNPQFNVQFSTYAVPMILGEIRRFMRDTNSLRISRSLRDIAYRALMSKERIISETGKEPTIDEIAKDLELSYTQVFFALNATSSTLSLDETIFDSESKGVSMMEKIAAADDETDILVSNIMLEHAIKSLGEREREILVMRYFHGKTQIEVSREVGISQAQVSRLEKTALAGIEQHMK